MGGSLSPHTPEKTHTAQLGNMATHTSKLVLTFVMVVSSATAVDLSLFQNVLSDPMSALGNFFEHPEENARTIMQAGEEQYRSFMAEPEEGFKTLFEVGNDFMSSESRLFNLEFTNFTNSISIDQMAQLFAGGIFVLLISFLIIELLAQNKEAGSGASAYGDSASSYAYTDRYGDSSAYDHLYSVSRSLYNGYKKYDQAASI